MGVVAGPAALRAVRCRFGCDAPVAIYHVPQGCICWADPVQALCAQHALKAQSTGAITMIVDLTVDNAWSKHREAIDAKAQPA